MLDTFLLVGLPYLALVACIVGTIQRFRREPYNVSALSSQFLEHRTLKWGSVPWHAGIIVILLAHIFVFLFPGVWRAITANAMATASAAPVLDFREFKRRGEVFVKEGAGELLLSREIKSIARSQNASMGLVGTYSPAASFTYVSMKRVRTEDSRIIRGHDYALPNDRDVQRLLVQPR